MEGWPGKRRGIRTTTRGAIPDARVAAEEGVVKLSRRGHAARVGEDPLPIGLLLLDLPRDENRNLQMVVYFSAVSGRSLVGPRQLLLDPSIYAVHAP